MSLVTREGLVETKDTVEDLQDQIRPAFATWAKRGDLRSGLSVEHLPWEFVTPLVAIWVLYLHGHISTAERKRGRGLAARHVDHFLSTCSA